MRRKLALLASSFALFLTVSVMAIAVAQEDNMPMSCTWQYTWCSDNACPTGPGADGQHVYHCTTHPYVRTVDTCCGG